MSAPEHTPSNESFLGLVRHGSASKYGEDREKEHAFSRISRKLKSVSRRWFMHAYTKPPSLRLLVVLIYAFQLTMKSDKPVDKGSIRIVRAIPAMDDIILEPVKETKKKDVSEMTREELLVCSFQLCFYNQ